MNESGKDPEFMVFAKVYFVDCFLVGFLSS